MRLYAFLLLACLALGARAATIASPDVLAPESEKKIPEIKNPVDKSENIDSELELIDQVNTIKDVENNLRVKPVEGIPVAVIAEPALKASEEEEDIIRPEPDLKNPGLPQRQLHETQSPEYHETEQQQTVLSFDRNIKDAQVVLREGFQGVSEGIQHIDDNEKLKNIQRTIQALRDGFTTQINRLNDSIHIFVNPENSGSVRSAENDASFQKIELGLNTLKNDFNAGVKTLAQGVDVVASLRDDNENIENSEDSGTAETPTVPLAVLTEYMESFQQTLTTGFNNLTQAINSYFEKNQKPDAASPPANAQADTPAAPENPFTSWINNIPNPLDFFNQTRPGGIGQIFQNIQNPFSQNPTPQSNSQPAASQSSTQSQGPIQSVFESIGNIGSTWVNIFQPSTAAPSTAHSSASKPAESKPQDQAASQADVVTAAGPVKLLLQNNPITQAVKRIQERTEVIKQKDTDIVKPEGEVVKAEEQKVEAEKVQDEKVEEASKGGYYGSGAGGDNNDHNSRVEEKNEIVKEEQKDTLPEEPKKEAEVQEEKQDETVKKTE